MRGSGSVVADRPRLPQYRHGRRHQPARRLRTGGGRLRGPAPDEPHRGEHDPPERHAPRAPWSPAPATGAVRQPDQAGGLACAVDAVLRVEHRHDGQTPDGPLSGGSAPRGDDHLRPQAAARPSRGGNRLPDLGTREHAGAGIRVAAGPPHVPVLRRCPGPA